MKVAVPGSHGFIGSALIPTLKAKGHQIIRLVRSEPERASDTIYWNPASDSIDMASIEGVEAVIHLAGESIFGRWTSAKKKEILDSRVEGTRRLAQTLTQLKRPPAVLVCASAIGIYGDRGADWLEEDSLSGSGFLADVCRQWETAAQPAVQHGIRVVSIRTGIVLSPKGGALAQMLPPFRMGVGGRVGSGNQYMSWIALDDLIEAYHHALSTTEISGAVNAVAPHPVTNLEFTGTLGKVLSRPAIIPLPAFAVRAVFGEMGVELLLSSARVRPARLLNSSFNYRCSDLETALRQLLGR